MRLIRPYLWPVHYSFTTGYHKLLVSFGVRSITLRRHLTRAAILPQKKEMVVLGGCFLLRYHVTSIFITCSTIIVGKKTRKERRVRRVKRISGCR